MLAFLKSAVSRAEIALDATIRVLMPPSGGIGLLGHLGHLGVAFGQKAETSSPYGAPSSTAGPRARASSIVCSLPSEQLPSIRAIVLGSAAGGGFPQWNCGCPNCTAVREQRPGYLPRTQDSIAVTASTDPMTGRYALVNASPEILAQIQRTRALWPRSPRHSPIAAIVLTNGDMDHVLGLFSLRESTPLALYTTASVRRGLEESAFIRTLRRFEGQLVMRELYLGQETALADAAGEPLGLSVIASAMSGKLPVHFVGHAKGAPEDNIALSFGDGQGSLMYAAAGASANVDLDGHDVVLFDGTFYREDELVSLGLSKAYARDMAHVPIDGENGSLARLSGLKARRIYTHVNNTNPILAPDSAERRSVEEAGWEIAYDGMEIVLERSTAGGTT
jgi:pyrroloquinoline quinone biosynthesis protein B